MTAVAGYVCPFTGKKCYSLRDANTILHRMRRSRTARKRDYVPRRSYLCPECGAYHLAHLWGVCNPVYISEIVERRVARPEWRDYLREDIRILVNCDAVAMLPGWERSKGARLEHHIAEESGTKVLLYEGGKE